jgi:pilus assembly protein CpaC
VTEVDPENQIRVGNIAVPGMKVRKSETTVELPSGSVMMTAGLISNRATRSSTACRPHEPADPRRPVPLRDYQRKETELMIMVTPSSPSP